MNNPKTTLGELYDAMAQYNRSVAPGSECNAWQDFVDDCWQLLCMPPWDDETDSVMVPADMAEYWLDVVKGRNPSYDREGGRSND